MNTFKTGQKYCTGKCEYLLFDHRCEKAEQRCFGVVLRFGRFAAFAARFE